MAAAGFGYSSAVCLNCNQPSGGRTRCKRCMAMTTAANKKRRARYRAEGRCPTCGVATGNASCDVCLQKDREKKQRVRLECIAAYGGACTCCGESRIEFLQIDHIACDGAAERASVKERALPQTIYNRLKRQAYPAGFRVLCACCHFALTFYGYCPHRPSATQPVRGRPSPEAPSDRFDDVSI